MGKILISDETNSAYTAQVTNGRQVRANTGSGTHLAIASGASSSTVVLNSTPCWIDRIIIGSLPATATDLLIYDTSGTTLSAADFDVAGANRIAKIDIPVDATASQFPGIIDVGVYCTSGLTYALGGNSLDGNLDNITIIYQT